MQHPHPQASQAQLCLCLPSIIVLQQLSHPPAHCLQHASRQDPDLLCNACVCQAAACTRLPADCATPWAACAFGERPLPFRPCTLTTSPTFHHPRLPPHLALVGLRLRLCCLCCWRGAIAVALRVPRLARCLAVQVPTLLSNTGSECVRAGTCGAVMRKVGACASSMHTCVGESWTAGRSKQVLRCT